MGALARARQVQEEKLAAAVTGGLHRLARDVGGRGNTLHTQLEIVGVGCVLERRFVIDQTGLEKIPERLIEGLHAVLRCAGGNRIADGTCLFWNQNALAYERRVDHYLDRGNASLGIGALDQSLADDGPKNGC